MQTVPAGFNALANGDVRPISTSIRIAFDKTFDDDVTFFTLDQSSLNGIDILAPSDDNPIQAWDYYEYLPYSERIIDMAVRRSIEFPYSVVSAVGDFTLNNYDKYLTPNGTSPIAQYVLPKRPVRLLQGFSNTLLPQFVGLTQGMPEISRTDGTATFTAMDFLTMIYDMDITDMPAMQNVRTDEVIEYILTKFGLTPAQYELAKGSNTIPFLFFTEDQLKAGDVIRPLMQAEGGKLWLDEQGIIRFIPRVEQPNNVSYIFDRENIVSIDNSEDDEIINQVIIKAGVRILQEPQIVYSVSGSSASDDTAIPASSSSYPVSLDLQDPAVDIVTPSYGFENGESWFTVVDGSGVIVTSGVSLVSTIDQTNNYVLFIQNSNSYPVYIENVVLWGRPAKISGGKATIYDLYDSDSVEKYDYQTYTIENNFIQNITSARSLAQVILNEQAEYAGVVDMEVKGNPAIQLSDIIEIDYAEYSGTYRVIETYNKVEGQKYTQTLKCRRYTPLEWFVLDQSELNGTDVLAP